MDESPRCEYCGHRVGTDVECLAILMGTFKTSPRHGGFYFQPKPYPDNRKVMWVHWHCMEVMGFDFADANDDQKTECTFCPEELVGEENCFELELGHFTIQGRDTVWIGDKSHLGQVVMRALTYACWECIEQGFGEGCDYKFREMIGLPPLENDAEMYEVYDHVDGNRLTLPEDTFTPRKAPKRMGKRRIPKRRAAG